MHALACYSDPSADLETVDIWESSLPLPEKYTEVWTDNLILIAQSQVGNRESEQNYLVADDGITKKEGTRDLVQVVANGLIPCMMAVLFIATENPAFLVAYVASFAEAFADTTASGFGVFSKTTFDLFRMKKCECGISGGMSVIGTLSSLVAAALISLIPFFFGSFNITLVLISTVTAFAGVMSRVRLYHREGNALRQAHAPRLRLRLL